MRKSETDMREEQGLPSRPGANGRLSETEKREKQKNEQTVPMDQETGPQNAEPNEERGEKVGLASTAAGVGTSESATEAMRGTSG